jgi:hypothetical protein
LGTQADTETLTSSKQPNTKKPSRVRLGTQEDLRKDFGSAGLLIGSPVRPTPSSSATSETPEQQPPAK